MVGIRLIELLIDMCVDAHIPPFDISIFSEEKIGAYNRVGMTSYFQHRDIDQLMIQTHDWYNQHGVTLVPYKVTAIDKQAKQITDTQGNQYAYDILVMATGSYAWVPPIPNANTDAKGLFVYRTVDDMNNIIAHFKNVHENKREQKTDSITPTTGPRAIIIGGGLLGLEAARAVQLLDVHVTVVDRGRILGLQLDAHGSGMLHKQVEQNFGINIRTPVTPQKIILGENHDNMKHVHGLELAEENQIIHTDAIVICTGVRPRDELAKSCGITCGERGGVVVVWYAMAVLNTILPIRYC